jgi:hypothetical protein
MRLAYKKQGIIKFCACYNFPTAIFVIIEHDLVKNCLYHAYYRKIKNSFWFFNFIDLSVKL